MLVKCWYSHCALTDVTYSLTGTHNDLALLLHENKEVCGNVKHGWMDYLHYDPSSGSNVDFSHLVHL